MKPRVCCSVFWCVVACLAILCSATRACWYGENVENGSDIVMMELRYPYWPVSTYFACWNMNFVPHGGSFYGGVAGSVAPEKPELQDAFRPGTVWSFWPHPDYQGDVVRNVYMHPSVYAYQYIGEGASGSAGAKRAEWIARNRWYRMVARVWSPLTDADKQSFIGWWMKDVAGNTWRHMGTFRVPCQATGFNGNSGFLEDFGDGGRHERELHRRLGYYRLDGQWKKADTVTINVAKDTGTFDHYWTVRKLEDDTALSMQYTCNPKYGRNLEPGGEYKFTVNQPEQPPLDPIEVTDAAAKVCDGQLSVSWAIPPGAAPQLGHKVEVFDNPDFQGAPATVRESRTPHVKVIRLDSSIKQPHVRLTVTDIFDRQKTLAVPVQQETEPLEAIVESNVRPGLGYRYYESATAHPYGETHNWQSIPDFAGLDPKQSGIARGLDTSFRGGRPAGYAFEFAGYLQVPRDGIYTLVLKSCDGSRVKLDGQLVFNNDALHSATERRTAVALRQGLHRFECEYFKDHSGHNTLWLGWEGPGVELQEIPASAYYCDEAADIPTIELAADSSDNPVRLVPRIEDRGKSISKVEVFRDRLIWGEASQRPFAIENLLCQGANRLWARMTYGDRRTVDSRVLELTPGESDLAPWSLAVQGETGLPYGLCRKEGVLNFIGEGEYFLNRKAKGDFTLTCRVDSVLSSSEGADASCWMGLMAKDTDKQYVGYDFGLYHTAGFGVRGTPNDPDLGGDRMSSWKYPAEHPWLRLVRRGNVFTSHTSPDGQKWHKAAEWCKPMREELFVGLSARTIPYKSRSLFRGTASQLHLQADLPTEEKPTAAGPFDRNTPCITGLVQSRSEPKMICARTTHDGLLISTDGGATWRSSQVDQGLAVRSVAIHPADVNTLLCAVGGKRGSALLKSTDGGTTWQQVSQAIDFDGQGPTRFCGEIVGFDPDDPKVAIAAGETKGLFISRDTGDTWEPLGLEGERITCAVFQPLHKPGYLLVGTCADDELALLGSGKPASPASKGDQGRLYITRNHGQSWEPWFARPQFGITNVGFEKRDGNMFCLATTRGIYNTFDCGRTMYQVMEGIQRDTPYTAIAAHFMDFNSRYYVAPLGSKDTGQAFVSENWTQSWDSVAKEPFDFPVVAILSDAADPKTVWLALTDGIVKIRTEDKAAEYVHRLDRKNNE